MTHKSQLKTPSEASQTSAAVSFGKKKPVCLLSKRQLVSNPYTAGEERHGGRRTAQTLTKRLEIECHHLASSIPEDLWHVVGRIHPSPFGIDPAKLFFVVSGWER